MNVKEYLQKVQDGLNDIREQQEYIERLRGSLGIAGIRYDTDKVQSSPDPDRLADVFSKIIEEEQKLEEKQIQYVEFRNHVIEQIHQLEDEAHRKILYIVYVDGKTIKECASDVGYSYDYTCDLHGYALDVFSLKFSDSIPYDSD